MKDSPLCQFPCPIYNIFSQHDSDPEYSLFLFSALIYNGKKKNSKPQHHHTRLVPFFIFHQKTKKIQQLYHIQF